MDKNTRAIEFDKLLAEKKHTDILKSIDTAIDELKADRENTRNSIQKSFKIIEKFLEEFKSNSKDTTSPALNNLTEKLVVNLEALREKIDFKTTTEYELSFKRNKDGFISSPIILTPKTN